MNNCKLVGITGGIGAGKSTVSKIFAAMGAAVYDADSRAKTLQVEDEKLKAQIIEHFGRESYLDNGQLNRTFLAKEVFSDEEKLKLINSLVHPVVAEDFKAWVAKHSNHEFVIKEAALMIESGSYQNLDFLIAVTAPRELRTNRVLLRDKGRSKEQIESIIDKQVSENQLRKHANFIIANDGNQLLIPQVLSIHKKIVSSAAG